jgi:hypothetical protein
LVFHDGLSMVQLAHYTLVVVISVHNPLLVLPSARRRKTQGRLTAGRAQQVSIA